MDPRYVFCRGGAHDNERWPLSHCVGPGHRFSWEDGLSGADTGYAVEAEIIQTNLGPMWVATPARRPTSARRPSGLRDASRAKEVPPSQLGRGPLHWGE